MAFGETGMSGNRVGQMSGDNGPHRLHREIDCTRRAMDETLSALSQRLTPGHLLDDALGFLRGSAGGGSVMAMAMRYGGKAAWKQARRHPVPAALIAAGMAWMIMEGRRRDRSSAALPWQEGEESGLWNKATSAAQSAAETASSKARQAAESARQMGQQAAEMGYRAADSAREIGHRAADRARHMSQQAAESARQIGQQARQAAATTGQRLRQTYHSAAEQTTHAIEDYPLAACCASLAAGAVIGYALPRTRAEDRLCGETASRIKEQAREMGRQAVERGREMAGAAAQAAREAAEEQGLTPSAVSEKISQVAQAAKGAAQEQIGGEPGDQAQRQSDNF